MEDPNAARPGNWEEGPHGLVRPYLGPGDDDTDGSPDAMGGSGEAAPWDRYIFSPQAPVADPGGPFASARPGDRADLADLADQHTTRLSARRPVGGRPHRHARPSRLRRFAGFAARPRSLAAAAVSAVAVAGIIYLVLPSTPRAMPAANGMASTASSGSKPQTSLADRANGTMSMPTIHAATPRAVSTAVSKTAKPKSVTGTSSSSTTSNPSLIPGSVISIEATTACCTSFSIAHDDSDNRVVITQVTSGSSPAARADATWIVRKGLADSSCISFESADASGEYLRHHDFELFLDPDDGSAKFAQDATFCAQPGNVGQGYSFESYNDSQEFIRHFNYVVYIASDGGPIPWDTSTLWHHDTTWKLIQPWS